MAFRTLPLIILYALLTACSDQGDPGVIAGKAHVIDGDSLEVADERIRLFGIDAPEHDQTCGREPCGEQAIDALKRKVEGRAVSCTQRDLDRYGRIVAACYLDGVDVGGWMVESGLAVAYTTYSTDYVGAEQKARQREAGLWEDRASFEKPWEFRQRQAAQAAAAPPPGDCVIKGNISADGERIYHSPGQEHYDRTRISTAKGERWFCDAAEAEAAGWRAARR
jgi:endonuclease YncB( thermonuclease family)